MVWAQRVACMGGVGRGVVPILCRALCRSRAEWVLISAENCIADAINGILIKYLLFDHVIRNAKVVGSTPITGTIETKRSRKISATFFVLAG